jgi:hypothetical protein
MQLREKIGFAAVDLLYSESLTKSTKKKQRTAQSALLSALMAKIVFNELGFCTFV